MKLDEINHNLRDEIKRPRINGPKLLHQLNEVKDTLDKNEQDFAQIGKLSEQKVTNINSSDENKLMQQKDIKP